MSEELSQGVKDAIPIVLGYLPLGFAFGVLAGQAGMSVFQAGFMSLVCFTGAGQYIAIGLMKAQGAILTIITTNLLVSLRYFLFSTALVPHLKKNIPTPIATLLAYGITDETYAVAINRYQQHQASTSYMASLNITAHLGWLASTLLGALCGTLITNTDKLGLGFALPAMYTCLLVLMISKKSHAMVAVFSAVTCLLVGYIMPSSMVNLSNIVIATLLGATLGVFIDGRK
ncbi:MAG: AzlC family ABC transporter permease [Syntrophomonadaceae bacterium]|jgi:4-azaleucine resistance transporter AzlC